MPLPSMSYGAWLQTDALYTTIASNDLAATWGDDAHKVERITGYATQAAASAEAFRQMQFQGQALAIENHLLKGKFAGMRGRTITIVNDKLGYHVGLDVIVLGAQDDRGNGMSAVTVLRRV